MNSIVATAARNLGAAASSSARTHHLIKERELDKAAKSDMVPLPPGWDRMANGEPMPDIVAAVRRSRASH